ncbi:LegC family aminotransferase [Alicyclobacillus sp. SO9]|uniref:LegC family aminotransferase n=1 Tax=Alicyclobacillus sp. SO9 TaxID=2665646 RepID=UPI0018E6DC93|nr:LegC family aminotransferase [Alicyclobacillus sp. SO9]QQE78264.1 LegC family aminotransferase [Alicyclobacillus sp. SO9]
MNKQTFLKDVVLRLKSVLPAELNPTALHEPAISDLERDYVKACLDSGFVSSAGNFVNQFARELESFTGARHAIPTVNGTSALHLCLKLAGVQAGDEVLVPALTFIATANAVSYCNAVPHLVDCSPETLGIDPARLDTYLAAVCQMRKGQCWNRSTKRIVKAVVAMHALGHPVELDLLMGVCQKYGLELVEDAAESLGSRYKNRHTGTFGRLGALSFNGNKIITTGGGGAILTDDDELAAKAAHLTTVAKEPHPWDFVHDDIGYNYRMPNLNAAFGLAQMKRLPDFVQKKRHLAKAYEGAFRLSEHVRFLTEPEFATSNYWLNALILDETVAPYLEDLLALTHSEGIMTRPLWKPLHRQAPYQDCPRMDLSVSQRLAKQVMNIPSSPALGVADEDK